MLHLRPQISLNALALKGLTDFSKVNFGSRRLRDASQADTTQSTTQFMASSQNSLEWRQFTCLVIQTPPCHGIINIVI